jgi:lipooligosaccharide transport system permease protein
MATTTALAPEVPTQPPEGTMRRRVLVYWLIVYRQGWRATAFSSILTPLLFLGAMGYLLGSMVDSGARGGIPGVEYVMFLAPGLLAAQAMQAGVNDSTFSVLAGIKWRRFYLAMLATPLGVRDVLVGHLTFVLVRITLTSSVFLAVATAMGAIRSWWALLALPVAVLCGLAFAAPVFAFSATQTDGINFNVLLRFGVMPLFLFSGTFFPIDQLPVWMQPVVWATPLGHAIDLCRNLVLGTAEFGMATLNVGYMLLWVIVGFWLALKSFRRRLVV